MSFWNKLKKEFELTEIEKTANPVSKDKVLNPAFFEKETELHLSSAQNSAQQVKPSNDVDQEKKEKNNSQGKKTIERKIKDWQPTEGKLMLDVFQTEAEFCLQAPVAGIEPKDLNIFTEQGMLIIKGKREKPIEKEKKEYFFQECYWGPFCRKILLPDGVEADKIKFNLEKGILTIRLPKKK